MAGAATSASIRTGASSSGASRGGSRPSSSTGVQILSPRVIRDWPEGPFSTNLFWDRAIEAGRAWGLVHQGLWFDVGTPGAIAETEAALAEM